MFGNARQNYEVVLPDLEAAYRLRRTFVNGASIDRTGIYRDNRYLAGGMRVGAYPHAVFVSFNLTSDADTGLGRWTEEQIMEVFRSGRAPDRLLNLWGMPWFYLHYFTPDDARRGAVP